MEYLFAFQFWYCKLCVENQWGGREGSRKHFFVNFCFLELLYLSVGEGLRVGAENLIWRPAEISSFSSRDLSRRNKHDSIWLVSTRYFYILFLWAIVVSDFLPLEIHKHLVLPLSSITFTADSKGVRSRKTHPTASLAHQKKHLTTH